MPFIWEKYDSKREYELATRNFCPYTEVLQTVNNISNVNIMYRFSKIKYLLEEYSDSENLINCILDKDGFNTLFHLLANIDFFSGLSSEDFERMDIYIDIQKGLYGIDNDLFNRLSFAHKYKLLSYMLLGKNNKGRNNLFFDCITELFEVELDYSEFKETYIIQICIAEDYEFEGRYTAGELYMLTKELLCDFWINVTEYWQIPIGIIGEEIHIDNIQII